MHSPLQFHTQCVGTLSIFDLLRCAWLYAAIGSDALLSWGSDEDEADKRANQGKPARWGAIPDVSLACGTAVPMRE